MLGAAARAAPAGRLPQVACVTNGPSTYSATFGYENDTGQQVDVPVGPQNRFDPEPIFRGQPGEFVPGIVRKAVTVSGVPNATNLTWLVDSGNRPRSGSSTARASADFTPKCPPSRSPSRRSHRFRSGRRRLHRLRRPSPIPLRSASSSNA